MHYVIDDIQRDGRVSTGRSHVRIVVYVSFWPSKAAHDRGDAPQWREDFLMDVLPRQRRIVTNLLGHWQRASDRRFVNPLNLSAEARGATEWAYETVTTSVAELIRENIERYLARGANKVGDQFEPRVQKRSDDPDGVLDREEVQALKRTAKTVTRTQLDQLRGATR